MNNEIPAKNIRLSPNTVTNTMTTMKLYHGTTPSHAEAILEDGLQPRRETGNSNWDTTDMESISDHVYLTDPFAPHYAVAASENSEIALVEIETDTLRERDLYPDEDFIEQAIRSDELDIQYPVDRLDLTGYINERTATVRDHIELFQPYWESSLEILGNIAHKGTIPVDAITRIAVSDPPSQIRLSIDPTIEIHAVGPIRSKYETFTKLLMGDEVTPVEYLTAAMGIPVPNGASPSDMLDDDDMQAMLDTQNIDIDAILTQEYVTQIA